jgi:hypothetical protein
LDVAVPKRCRHTDCRQACGREADCGSGVECVVGFTHVTIVVGMLTQLQKLLRS